RREWRRTFGAGRPAHRPPRPGRAVLRLRPATAPHPLRHRGVVGFHLAKQRIRRAARRVLIVPPPATLPPPPTSPTSFCRKCRRSLRGLPAVRRAASHGEGAALETYQHPCSQRPLVRVPRCQQTSWPRVIGCRTCDWLGSFAPCTDAASALLRQHRCTAVH